MKENSRIEAFSDFRCNSAMLLYIGALEDLLINEFRIFMCNELIFQGSSRTNLAFSINCSGLSTPPHWPSLRRIAFIY